MRKVGAVAATFRTEEDGSSIVDLTLPDGRVKQMALPRTAKIINDKKGRN